MTGVQKVEPMTRSVLVVEMARKVVQTALVGEIAAEAAGEVVVVALVAVVEAVEPPKS